MLQEAPAFGAQAPLHGEYSSERLRQYLDEHLQLLEKFPNFVRSLIGEADQYPPEHRQALRLRLQEMQQTIANHLEQMVPATSAEDLAKLIGAVLVGYAVIEATTGDSLWEGRNQFLDTLTTLVSTPAHSELSVPEAPPPALVVDLPTSWVQQLMKYTRSVSLQDHAIALLLFGAGLLPTELIGLERAHQISDKSQHILQIMGSHPRQVPVNQWILGKRYGSYTNNPLSRWLKSRKDGLSAMFLNAQSAPLELADLKEYWDTWWQGVNLGAEPPKLIQARQTWCVEMLMRGISLENLSILTGCQQAELQPFAQRAKEKAAIAAATQLDRKNSSS
ncbi:MAG: tyrosine-type recombinase/integrase, partial [Cyanobacteria bacterium J06642_11]